MKFRESLLEVMDAKDPLGLVPPLRPKASRAQLLVHYQQEYLTYIRDFPRFLGRVHGNCRIPARGGCLRRTSSRETGGLSRTGPHPVLFLEMMRGLGFLSEVRGASLLRRRLAIGGMDRQGDHPAALGRRRGVVTSSSREASATGASRQWRRPREIYDPAKGSARGASRDPCFVPHLEEGATRRSRRTSRRGVGESWRECERVGACAARSSTSCAGP